MSQTTSPPFLMLSRGVQRELETFVVAARFSRDGRSVAFGLGDGTLRVVHLDDIEAWHTVAAHDGTVLALAAAASSSGFISGGDDGAFRRVAADAAASDIARFGMKWVEHVASFPGDKGKGA